MAISPQNREAVIEFVKSNKNSLHYSNSGGNYAALRNMPMCFAESSCVFQASELTKRHSNNQFVTFVLLVLAAKDNHEFHTNSNKFISIHLKRSGAAMCVSALILSF